MRSRCYRARRRVRTALPSGSLRIARRQHADIAADVGIPDVAIRIDGDAVGTGVVARKLEGGDLPSRRRPRLELRTMPNQTAPSAATARPLRPAFSSPTSNSENLPSFSWPMPIGAELEEPHRAVGADGHIGRNRTAPRQLDRRHRAAWGDAKELAAALQGRPHNSVRRSPPRRRVRSRPIRLSWRVKVPSFSWVMPYPVASANQAEPSGAMASRPKRMIAASSAKCETSPELAMRTTAPAAMSVYQALPSAATASPSGSKLRPGVGSCSMRPPRNAADGIGVIDREPDGAVGGGGNRDRRILRIGHAGIRQIAPSAPRFAAARRRRRPAAARPKRGNAIRQRRRRPAALWHPSLRSSDAAARQRAVSAVPTSRRPGKSADQKRDAAGEADGIEAREQVAALDGERARPPNRA